jgi:hypothetical protein
LRWLTALKISVKRARRPGYDAGINQKEWLQIDFGVRYGNTPSIIATGTSLLFNHGC